MARFAVGLVFGMVVGVVAGAAAGLHAADEAGATLDDSPPEESPVQAVATPEPAVGIWDALAQCESTGNWRANTGNSYFGGLQEDLTFWRRHGGLAYAARPDLATRAAQIAVAQVGLSVQGPGAWPVCGPKVGLHR